jgi:hypothetical protein
MTITNKEMKTCLRGFVKLLSDQSFLKTSGRRLQGEREILVALKFFLKGRYKRTDPEASVNLGLGKNGRFDFKVAGLPIEVAVQPKMKHRNRLYRGQNEPEVRKCAKHRGRAMLALIDLTGERCLSSERLNDYRDHPKNLGKGNHKLTAFDVVYVYSQLGKVRAQSLNIRY